MNQTNLTNTVRALIEEASKALSPTPQHFYEQQVLAYSQKVTSDISTVLSSSASKVQLRNRLVGYLASNWNFVKGNNLSYTATADSGVTTLLAKIAVLLSNNNHAPLSILMPGVSFEPTNIKSYPDLKQAVKEARDIKRVLKTHILSTDARALIPISILHIEDILSTAPLPNVYFDVLHEAYEGMSEEALTKLATLNEEEINRLYNHSALTQNIKEAADKYRELKEDKSTFLGQLTCFLKALFLHSANVLGTEELAGTGIYPSAESFYAYYHNLEAEQKNNIPQTLVDELTLLEDYFSGKKVADIGSCFATRHNAIKSAMSGHETCLALIGLSDKNKNLMISEAKTTFEQGLKQLETTLNAKTNGYEGEDKLGINGHVLQTLQLRLQFGALDNVNQLVRRLNPKDIPILFQDEQTQQSFFQTVNNIEKISALILDTSNETLYALFSALDKDRLSAILMEELDVFCNLYQLLDENKKNTLLSCINIDYRDRKNRTVLIWAVEKGHTDIALALIGKGASLDEIDRWGTTALISAAYKGHTEVALALIEAEANIDARNTPGNTALIWATRNNHKEITHALIVKGARLDVQDEGRKTALIWAVSEVHTEIALALIDKGADLDKQDAYGRTALIWAAEKGHKDIALALIKKGASLDEQDNYSYTALTWAMSGDHKEIALALIENGAGLDGCDYFGNNALIWAAYKGYTEITLALIEKRARLNERDRYNRTALIYAAQEGHKEITLALIKAGATVEDEKLKDVPFSMKETIAAAVSERKKENNLQGHTHNGPVFFTRKENKDQSETPNPEETSASQATKARKVI